MKNRRLFFLGWGSVYNSIHIILTWIYSICITFINFVLNFNPIIVTPVGHLITDPKKIRDILNLLLYTGTNFEDLSRKTHANYTSIREN